MTPAIIAINAALYAWQVLGGFARPDDAQAGVLEALILVPGETPWWTYLTSAFLHDPSGVLHILGNMLVLWVFGPVVEDRLGRIGFSVFYLLGAVVAGLAHTWVSSAPVIGASGAVSAVTGAAFVLFPRVRVRTLVIFFIIGIYMVPAWFYIGLAVARDILPVVTGARSRIAYEAHLGGYVFGAGVSVALLWFKVLAREQYDLFTITKHANRRRAFKAAASGVEAERRARIERVRAAPEDPAAAKIAERRAGVSAAIAEGELDRAGDLYEELVSEFGDREGAAVLNKRAQYTLAGHLYRSGRLELAAEAFGRYLMAFPMDEERGEIALLLARVQRALGRTEEALGLLGNAVLEIRDESLRETAERELQDLRAASEGG